MSHGIDRGVLWLNIDITLPFALEARYSSCCSPLRQVLQKPSADDVNRANNPLTPAITVNFQNQAQPQLYDLDQGSNAFLLRGVVPYKIGGIPQLLRYTLPVVSAPNGTGGTTTGVGDLNLFNIFPFLWKQKKMELGLGPQFTFPTATETATGTGKWQAGVVALAVAPRKWGIAGILLTWQHSFAVTVIEPARMIWWHSRW